MGSVSWSPSGLMLGALDLDSLETDTGVVWVTNKFDGWGATKTTLEVVQRPRANGGWAGESFSAARSLALSGTMVAPDALLASDALDRLNEAASLYENLLVVTEGGRERWMMVRRSDEVLMTWTTPESFEWSIQLVALDPRKFADELTASTVLPSSSGGMTVPFTVPFSVNAVTNSGQVSLENVGNEAGPVVLRIDGPCTGPVITHVGSGLALVFASSLVLGAGEWLTVDMEAKSVMANDQASRNTWVISRGWSQFAVGQNTWAFTAAAYGPESRLTVSATPAWK